MSAFIQSLGPGTVFALLFAVLAGAGEAGRGFGGRFPRRGAPALSAAAAAAFALSALLIAAAFSIAAAHHDRLRGAVVEEAAALRAAARLAPLLPDDDGPAIVNDLRRMRALALGFGAPFDPARFDADMADTDAVSDRLWAHLGAAVAAEPGSLSAARMAQALIRLDDAVGRRTASLRDPPPLTVYGVIVGTAVLAMAFAGRAGGVAGPQGRAAAIIVALLLSAVVAALVSFQRFDAAAVDASLAPLRNIASLLPPLP